MKSDIDDLLRQQRGVIRRADHPQLVRRLDRCRDRGELASPLPGVLWLPECADDLESMILAGQLWAGPNAVLTGRAAARFTFWPDAEPTEISFASGRRRNQQIGRWSLRYRVVPPEYVLRTGPVNLTSAALTAVDLASGDDGGDVIDRVLRSRRRTGVTLHQLWQAFRSQPGRYGNPARKAVLLDSRDNPWSEGERLLHRLLRRHGITGWRTNVRLDIRGERYFVDVIFGRQRLVVEFDGWEFHSSHAAFESDRFRRNELVLAGYRVLNFTWAQLIDQPEWVLSCIKRGLR